MRLRGYSDGISNLFSGCVHFDSRWIEFFAKLAVVQEVRITGVLPRVCGIAHDYYRENAMEVYEILRNPVPEAVTCRFHSFREAMREAAGSVQQPASYPEIGRLQRSPVSPLTSNAERLRRCVFTWRQHAT